MPITVLTGETTAITSGVTTITDLVSQVWTIMTGNPLVMVFVGASLLGVAIGVIRKAYKGQGLISCTTAWGRSFCSVLYFLSIGENKMKNVDTVSKNDLSSVPWYMNRKLFHIINFMLCMLDTWLFIAPFIVFHVITFNSIISYPFTTPKQTALFGFTLSFLFGVYYTSSLFFSVCHLVDYFRKEKKI